MIGHYIRAGMLLGAWLSGQGVDRYVSSCPVGRSTMPGRTIGLVPRSVRPSSVAVHGGGRRDEDGVSQARGRDEHHQLVFAKLDCKAHEPAAGSQNGRGATLLRLDVSVHQEAFAHPWPRVGKNVGGRDGARHLNIRTAVLVFR